jgi:hypothetical protein
LQISTSPSIAIATEKCSKKDLSWGESLRQRDHLCSGIEELRDTIRFACALAATYPPDRLPGLGVTRNSARSRNRLRSFGIPGNFELSTGRPPVAALAFRACFGGSAMPFDGSSISRDVLVLGNLLKFFEDDDRWVQEKVSDI